MAVKISAFSLQRGTVYSKSTVDKCEFVISIVNVDVLPTAPLGYTFV